MNIAFLCSSLAAGRDGVGDYIHSLAEACRARGHRTLLIALRDSHTDLRTAGEEHGGLILRLPANVPLGAREQEARLALEGFAPDVVSWQFVPYGYHPKGLIGDEARTFAGLLKRRAVHVMLHELWIGIDRHEPWRNRLVGVLQRRGLLRWLDRLQPRQVQTSNVTYQRILAQHGRNAGVLPLFGNLPVAAPDPSALERWLPAGPRGGWLVAVTFGTLHPEWRPEATATALLGLSSRRERSLLLLACGRTGQHGPGLLRRFAALPGTAVTATGELPAQALSAILQAADCGVAPHPWALIGKSGAAAAMLEHGLPVLVPRDDWLPRHALPPLPAPTYDPLCARLADLQAPADWEAWSAGRRTPESRLPSVAEKFLSCLTA